MAKCRVCGIELTDENWLPYCKKKNLHICKFCNRQYRNQRYEANKEKRKEYNKKSSKRYREAHPERIKQFARQYYKAHKKERKQYLKQYREVHPEKIRQWNLKQKYGITLKQFDQMLKDQNNRCAICGKKFSKINLPNIDHNHKTQKIRALLCKRCNVAMGLLEEDPTLLDKTKLYITKYNNMV